MKNSILRSALVTTAALLYGISAAHAFTTNDTYYDLMRPNGHARGDAIFQADLNLCYGQIGSNRYARDTPAFKQCMLGRNWQWKSIRTVRGPGRRDGYGQAPAWTYQGCVFNPADC
jgi:hypothetical protein